MTDSHKSSPETTASEAAAAGADLRRLLAPLLVLFALSGAAGLIYQVIWSRMLTTVFGSTTASVTTVLACFMAGLALGSWAIGRWADRISRPLLVYALLEVGVDDYETGYRMIRARDAERRERDLSRTIRTVLDARLLHRHVLGEQPLQVKLLKGAARPSVANWAGTKGMLAASLGICGDGEDSLINTDVAIEATLAFLYTTALSRQPPPKPPAKPKPAPASTRRAPRKAGVK